MELECWPATAIVSQLHLARVNLSHVTMDTKSKPPTHILAPGVLYYSHFSGVDQVHKPSYSNVGSMGTPVAVLRQADFRSCSAGEA